jgi:hypothetical protein
MTRALNKQILLVAILAAGLLLFRPATSAHADGPDDVGGGYSCDCSDSGGGGIGAQAAGAIVIAAADIPAALIFIGCGGCPVSELYDYMVAYPATAAGLLLIFGGTAYGAGSGGSGFDGYSGGGGGGGGGGMWGAPEYSYGGGSW